MNLILFRRSELSADETTIVLRDKDPRTKHIFGHLRKADGDPVTIGIVSGERGKAIVRTSGAIGNRLELAFEINSSSHDSAGSSSHRPHDIVLLISLPFPKRLKALWAQIASMGVTRICVVRGALSDPNYCRSSVLTPEVYRPLLEEGMSQGCHTREVTVDVSVDEIVSRKILDALGLAKEASLATTTPAATKNSLDSNQCYDDDIRIFLDCGDETTEPPPCRKAIVDIDQKREGSTSLSGSRRVVVAIGSERGWTDDEAELFHDAGYQSASLGRSILRVDTAIIAGLGIVSAALDELQEQREGFRKRKHDAMR